ncbi:hypothetical protein AF71_00037190 [Rhizobium sp. 57MFTsu3.2]|nr:hypothetical protein [Rhizobium sp. 57MFTsu3.2]
MFVPLFQFKAVYIRFCESLGLSQAPRDLALVESIGRQTRYKYGECGEDVQHAVVENRVQGDWFFDIDARFQEIVVWFLIYIADINLNTAFYC